MVDQVVGASVVVTSMLMHMGSVHTFVDPWCVMGTLKWRFPRFLNTSKNLVSQEEDKG